MRQQNNLKRLSHGLLATLLLGSAWQAYALPSDRDQPIKVNADSASFDQKSGLATYRGHVIVQQGTLEVRADVVVLTLDKQGNVQKSTATGNPAHYQQVQDEKKGPVMADAHQIDYNAQGDTVVLTGNAVLKQDTSSLQGQKITYHITDQKVDAEGGLSSGGSSGGGRVSIEFKPATVQKSKDKSK